MVIRPILDYVSQKYNSIIEERRLVKQARLIEEGFKASAFSRLYQQQWLSDNILSAKSLRRQICLAKRGRSQCHIVASGYSLLDSYKMIDSSIHFTIGFNFSGLLPIDYDLYFAEFASSSVTSEVHPVSELQKHVIKSSKGIKNLVLKNIWQENRIERIFAQQSYGKNIPILLDIHTAMSDQQPFCPLLNVTQLANHLLCPQSLFVIQAYTTTFTCIALAHQCGFKQIVVHGLDLAGPHFYVDSSVKWPGVADPVFVAKIIKKSPKPGKSFGNITNTSADFRLQLLLALRNKLQRSGTSLLLSSSNSPISNHMETWH